MATLILKSRKNIIMADNRTDYLPYKIICIKLKLFKLAKFEVLDIVFH